MSRIKAVIGLEMHVQLATRSKIFCACATAFGASPNTQVCPVCLGHPGVLPILNRSAVQLAIRFGLAVGASIQPRSTFARKNYFYPDLPKGYQITQYDRPVLVGGAVPFRTGSQHGSLALTRAHLEEDAGKSFHGEGRDPASLIDLNRAGTPLLEVVSEPVLTSPQEAHAALESLHRLVVDLGVCDGNMEEGSLRCDANVSVRPAGQGELGPKVEIKNLNSFRHVERALAWEIDRQTRLLEQGILAEQETRLWNEGEGRTRTMRRKEDAEDYRYFPEPDLPPLEIAEAWIEAEREALPELPWERESRLAGAYALTATEAAQLSASSALCGYFEAVARDAGDGKLAANWVLTEVLRLLKETPGGVSALPVDAARLGALLRLVREGTVSGSMAKNVFEVMETRPDPPRAIVEANGWGQVGGDAELEAVARRILEEHPGPADEYRNGKDAAMTFLMGQMMKATRGTANPPKSRAILHGLLRGSEESP